MRVRSSCFKHPLELVGSIDATFKAQPDEPTHISLPGSVVILQEDTNGNDKPHNVGGLANVVDFIVRIQKRCLRSTSFAELNGLVDDIEQLLLLQIILHQIHCGTHQTPEDIIDLAECGGLYPQLDVAIDARAIFYVVAATDACDFSGMQLKNAFDIGPGSLRPRHNKADALGRHEGYTDIHSQESFF